MYFFHRLLLSFLFIGICFFSCFCSSNQQGECTNKEVDKEIEYLEDLKRGIEGKATLYENKAQRLQFESNQLFEAKKFWEMADQNREAAKEIQQKIDEKKQNKTCD
jgi:hypothetical protein